ncbi:hypothetical protein V5799_003254 [Amblyomma americanum]|uniref:Secreted protein n=1 Tax=Amblyomma americanum TaxID=6943 RepID=A0AAQ4D9H4_AMBAM
MKSAALFVLVMATLTVVIKSGVPPRLGIGLHYACTHDCYRRALGRPCGRNCTCHRHPRRSRALICLENGSRRPAEVPIGRIQRPAWYIRA